MSDETIDSGGPAFPGMQVRQRSSGTYYSSNYGMTLRAWFAGHALAGLAGDKSIPCEQAAELAVRYADDLIARLKLGGDAK